MNDYVALTPEIFGTSDESEGNFWTADYPGYHRLTINVVVDCSSVDFNLTDTSQYYTDVIEISETTISVERFGSEMI